jgi:hypothetical protein
VDQGDRFRAAPNLVLFNSPRAYGDIHGNRANTARSNFYKAWKRNERDVHTMNCSTDRVAHAKKRKNLNLIFTEQSLKAASPTIVQHVDRWIHLLTTNVGGGANTVPVDEVDTEGWSQPCNMATWVESLIFDILGDLCFGEAFNTKEPGESKLRTIPQMIMQTVALGYKVGLICRMACPRSK